MTRGLLQTVFALSTPLLLGNPLPSYLNSPSIPPSFPPLFLSFPPLSPLHLSSILSLTCFLVSGFLRYPSTFILSLQSKMSGWDDSIATSSGSNGKSQLVLYRIS